MSRTRMGAAGALLALPILAMALGACAPIGESPAAAADTAVTASDLWGAAALHEIDLRIADAELEAALDAYLADGEKIWVEAAVTIDGVSFDRVGLKLKGNSSLREITADTDPATIPWRIRLDKFVEGQSLDGETDLVVRGNSSSTSLNEAVALTLLDAAGLASQSAMSAAFSVNGGQAQLRLIIQNPDEAWTASRLGEGTLLYKSEAEGSWDYVGDDPADYAASFDQEAGEEDLAPLIEFLEFVNESDDETFAAELDEHLDVEAFARYLAYQDLVENMDDIDGPGNNSYLAYDPTTARMTVVNWDLNLAFGQTPGAGGQGMGFPGGQGMVPTEGQGMTPPDGQGPGLPGGQRPDGMSQPRGAQIPGGFPTDFPTALPEGFSADGRGAGFPGAAAGGPGGISNGNVLAERFRADASFAALIDQAAADLQAELVDSGLAADVLDAWSAMLVRDAGALVDAETVGLEADSIARILGIR